ncbi:MAG: hypothetical protein WD969_04120 [Paracoccaceae bacterium]
MSARAATYEDFAVGRLKDRRAPAPEGESVELLLARVRGQARADGFADGVAQTEARIARDLETRMEAVASAIELARADRAAAAERAGAAASKIVAVFLRAVAPRLAERNLAPEIAAAFDAALACAPEERLVIEIRAERRSELVAALGARAEACEIVAAADLGDLEARIRWRGGFDLIDTGAAIARALRVLEAHLDAEHETSTQESELSR